ncbi:hypothetical protein [uncultured Algibacter sp.]|uniref:hypothetical protein n=1 Tax=uncultured Algibacter sp. TaxID=298659 RepID=UPI003217136B
MKGLEFFKSKSHREDSNYEELKKIFDFSSVPLFKLFISSFELGNSNLKRHQFLETKFNNVVPCGSVLIKLETISGEYFFSGFFNENELINDWESYSVDSHEFLEYGLVRIGDIGIGGGIFIGTKDDKKDKIYLVNWGLDEDYILISDNIFEFSRLLIFVEDKSNMENVHGYSRFYKNWGEDFWRVKE